jgi:hypothetical protein
MHPQLITLLRVLDVMQEEIRIHDFMRDHNPWKTEAYFLGQITTLRKFGYVETTGTRSRKIQISQKGQELLKSVWS